MGGSLNEIAAVVLNGLNEPFNSVLNEQIKFSIKYWYAFLARQDIERNGVSEEMNISYVTDLVKVDIADNNIIDADCTVLRTKNKIFTPIRLKSDTSFKFVGTTDRKISFTYTNLEELKYTCANKYTNNIIRYMRINGYIYVYNATKIKHICIDSIPVDAGEVLSYVNDKCYDDDDEFPIPMDMLQPIIRGMITGEYKIQPMNNVNEEQVQKSE